METVATLERRRETLIKKAKEYHKELESLLVSSFFSHLNFNFSFIISYITKIEEPLQVSTTVSQLLEQKEKNQIRERELKEKRAKIKAFQGLPPVSIILKKPSSNPLIQYDGSIKILENFLNLSDITPWYYYFFFSQNLELARHELRAARQKQMELIQLRERLLGRMADGVV